MNEEQKRMNDAIQIIRIEIGLIKGLLNSDQRIFFDQQIDKQYRNFINENPGISEDERLSIYEMFESSKMNVNG